MAGIYIHIPFCKSRCTYCDFYTQTNTGLKAEIVNAICKELAHRKDYLNNETIQTIYFGGGTPSLLSIRELNEIFDTITGHFSVADNSEITLEANPDDLHKEYIKRLCTTPVNRLSIGIQSFDNNDLKFLNRRHSAEDAEKAVYSAQDRGFKNISIDLMYGLPHQTAEAWRKNISKAISLNVPHISSYHLIYEEGTPMYKLLDNGKIKAAEEELSLEMFSTLNTMLKENGYIHYEISNYAKEGFFSRHNSSYWKSISYLGIGPSAHSYNKNTRSWNISSIYDYIKNSKDNIFNAEIEPVDKKTAYNDYVLTRLRTMWGADLNEIETLFGEEYKRYFRSNVSEFLKSGEVVQENGKIKITETGLFISDRIMSDLMFID